MWFACESGLAGAGRQSALQLGGNRCQVRWRRDGVCLVEAIDELDDLGQQSPLQIDGVALWAGLGPTVPRALKQASVGGYNQRPIQEI